ncbi:sensor histidine kinase [Azospirillum thermophilum]|uniref:histidine kinase n=1 Tax=Azospirillum thermophilum TaxID=2202148 RepID=A0A2S2CUU7_9PROT|nr:ATP-binding protein [Azospirillum thermophilum]AWK88271.1 histidine kinase [Azospirillum thermophilum]
MIPLPNRLRGPLRRYGLLVAGQLAATALLAAAFVWTADVYTRFLIAERRAAAAMTAVSISSTLSSALNERLALVRGLTAFVDAEVSGGTLEDRFAHFATALRRSVPGVRNISIAPDFVVRHVHPLEGNQRVLGNALLSDPRPGFAETVQRALVTGDVTVHGPVDLIQGGQGVIARQIVFGKDRPWGAVGMVFDVKPVLDELRLGTLPPDLGYVLRSDNGVTLAGDTGVLRLSPIIERVALPDGMWELAVAPRAGWPGAARAEPGYAAFLGVFLLLAVLTEMLAYLMLSRRLTLERLVERRTAELDAANRQLERFAYVTAHDLQEPLRAIASYTQLLDRHFRDRVDEEGAEFIRQIVDGAGRLKMLLRDVQLFLAEDRVPLAIRPVPVEDALQAALTILDRRVRDAGAAVTAGDLPVLLADERRLREILVVLIGNALEYRHPDRAAEISVVHRRVDGRDVIEVRDNGIGIEPQYREQIFEVFRRLHSREAHPGTGMGLAIARKMAERMGGRITVESTPGAGSAFSLHLSGSRSLSRA